MATTGIPERPMGVSRASFFRLKVWELLFGGKFPIKGKDGCKVEYAGETYWISAESRGGGGKPGIRWKIPKELDPAVAVSKDELVFISPDNALVTGLIDLATSELAYCPPGEWLCVKDCPAATEAGYNVPKLLPLTGANLADAPTVYWVLQQEHNPCVGV